jgi:hypothetical protein
LQADTHVPLGEQTSPPTQGGLQADTH